MTIETIIGIILILINVPVGWGGAILCGFYGQKTGKKFFYILSAVIYALSWGMLALGIYLCGRPYARYIYENYVVKYIYPLVIVCIVIAFVLIIVYRKKIFKKYKNDKIH